MRIQICLEDDEMGTAIEFANAVIKWQMEAKGFRNGVENLAEIAEHIQVYVNHRKEQE